MRRKKNTESKGKKTCHEIRGESIFSLSALKYKKSAAASDAKYFFYIFYIIKYFFCNLLQGVNTFHRVKGKNFNINWKFLQKQKKKLY